MNTCVNLEVHPEVAGITEGLAAVLTLVRLHPYMPHEVHIELSGCYESPGPHAALEFRLPYMALAFCSGVTVIRVSITAAVIVRLSRSMTVTRPRGRGRA